MFASKQQKPRIMSREEFDNLTARFNRVMQGFREKRRQELLAAGATHIQASNHPDIGVTGQITPKTTKPLKNGNDPRWTKELSEFIYQEMIDFNPNAYKRTGLFNKTITWEHLGVFFDWDLVNDTMTFKIQKPQKNRDFNKPTQYTIITA